MVAAKKTAAQGFDSNYFFSADAVKEGYEKFTTGMNMLADFHKNSLEAFLSSAGVIAKGMEQAAASQTSFAKEILDDGAAAAKAAASTKSVQDAIEVHNAYLRGAAEKHLGQASKIADHWTGIVKEASEPVSKKYSEFVDIAQTYRP